jgi:hypothetical protein
MPIAKALRRFYGAEWRAYRAELIALHGPRCSACDAEVPKYLNLAHLEHDQRSSRVALLCMPCHNRHDAAHRLAIWRRNRARRFGQLWISSEIEWAPYPPWLIPVRFRTSVEIQGCLFVDEF